MSRPALGANSNLRCLILEVEVARLLRVHADGFGFVADRFHLVNTVGGGERTPGSIVSDKRSHTLELSCKRGQRTTYEGRDSVKKYMPIPEHIVILLSGIPATSGTARTHSELAAPLLADRMSAVRYSARMSHPNPQAPPDRRPIEIGEVWENPITRERVTILERPWDNEARRAAAELTALVGARVVGEHRHPALVERFTVLEGELTVQCDGQKRILRQGETAVIEAGVWHDWWNASNRDARVRVEITPGERFIHLIETLFGLARLGHTDRKGMPYPLQLALIAREFSDIMVFRSPPLAVQPTIFGALALIGRWRGYRATYPELSRIVLGART